MTLEEFMVILDNEYNGYPEDLVRQFGALWIEDQEDLSSLLITLENTLSEIDQILADAEETE